ncbi:tyrosine-type recombinase/integrase [Dehalococcoidales bacterium]|nr:tyrosine-type recombinase/integrase [Dehalococcoidales bacterium]
MLGKSLADGDLVFCHPDGSPLDPGTVTHTFARVITKAGLPHIRFHDLRHTHATLMLKQGIHPIREIRACERCYHTGHLFPCPPRATGSSG